MKNKRINFIDADGVKHNVKDITGQKFGRLTAQEVAKVDKRSGAFWKCRCDCDDSKIVIVSRSALISGDTRSCGCLRTETSRASCYKNHERNVSVRVGEKYGKLTILEVKRQKQAGKSALCLCQCDCGSDPKWIDAHSLTRGNTKSCGCLVSCGENKIKQLLNDAKILYKSQWTTSECFNPKTHTRLRFDFYLPDNNICIEYDGQQHFFSSISSKGYYSYTKEQLEEIEYRDNIKNQYCLQAGIRLIRIPYTQYDELTSSFLLNIIEGKNKEFDVQEK